MHLLTNITGLTHTNFLEGSQKPPKVNNLNFQNSHRSHQLRRKVSNGKISQGILLHGSCGRSLFNIVESNWTLQKLQNFKNKFKTCRIKTSSDQLIHNGAQLYGCPKEGGGFQQEEMAEDWKLNEKTIGDRYLLPNITGLVDRSLSILLYNRFGLRFSSDRNGSGRYYQKQHSIQGMGCTNYVGSFLVSEMHPQSFRGTWTTASEEYRMILHTAWAY